MEQRADTGKGRGWEGMSASLETSPFVCPRGESVIDRPLDSIQACSGGRHPVGASPHRMSRQPPVDNHISPQACRTAASVPNIDGYFLLVRFGQSILVVNSYSSLSDCGFERTVWVVIVIRKGKRSISRSGVPVIVLIFVLLLLSISHVSCPVRCGTVTLPDGASLNRLPLGSLSLGRDA